MAYSAGTIAAREMTAAQRGQMEKAKRRVAELTLEIGDFARAGNDPRGHDHWQEFSRTASAGSPQAMIQQFEAATARSARAALIEECTGPIQPNMQFMATEEWLRRNNLLLAAILKHLTKDL